MKEILNFSSPAHSTFILNKSTFTQWKISSTLLFLFSYNLHFKHEYLPNVISHYWFTHLFDGYCYVLHLRHLIFSTFENSIRSVWQDKDLGPLYF